MRVFCTLKHHDQTGEAAMAGVCPVCMRENLDEIACKDPECPNRVEGRQHAHPPEHPFVDENGNYV